VERQERREPGRDNDKGRRGGTGGKKGGKGGEGRRKGWKGRKGEGKGRGNLAPTVISESRRLWRVAGDIPA